MKLGVIPVFWYLRLGAAQASHQTEFQLWPAGRPHLWQSLCLLLRHFTVWHRQHLLLLLLHQPGRLAVGGDQTEPTSCGRLCARTKLPSHHRGQHRRPLRFLGRKHIDFLGVFQLRAIIIICIQNKGLLLVGLIYISISLRFPHSYNFVRNKYLNNDDLLVVVQSKHSVVVAVNINY